MKSSFLSEHGWIVIAEHPEQDDAVYHVVPTDDILEHDISILCECSPWLDHKDKDSGDEVVVHRLLRVEFS